MTVAKIDIATVKEMVGCGYPKPFDEPCVKRGRKRLGDAVGLSQFGVNLMRLAPGVWSSQRHWHSHEDEFIYVVKGEVVLITDGGEEILRVGDCAGFPAGKADGHQLQNRSGSEALVLEVGTRSEGDNTEYSDIDMRFDSAAGGYTHKDGRPYAR
jgi:uncharacterized cupin superfamily protein